METVKEFVGRVRRADILVGIPSYNNESTIQNVVSQVGEGLAIYFPDRRGAIIVSDGNSLDSTRDTAESTPLPKDVELLVTTYEGIAGKGSAIKLVFELARRLGSQEVAMVDSDLRSITPEWVHLLVKPLIKGFGFVAPRYLRYKHDGTITNQIAYPMTTALYGVGVRQPIGGDFGLSRTLVDLMLESPLWATPYTPRFGIDISITHTALANKLPVAEALLGAKVHDVKDPTKHLAPMFRQVVGALFNAMSLYAYVWKPIKGFRETKVFKGQIEPTPPEPFKVGYQAAFAAYTKGVRDHASTIARVLPDELVETAIKCAKDQTPISARDWAKISFHFAKSWISSAENQKEDIIEAYRILWMGRVANHARDTLNLSDEEAESITRRDAETFVDQKDYLLSIWEDRR
jgi:glycosyltransferase involved in cell wall biosynthesis